MVVATLGASGAYFNCEESSGHVAGFAAQVVETLCAGDAFMAGVLHQISLQPSLKKFLTRAQLEVALRFANACGALATQTAGAIPALPTYQEVANTLGFSPHNVASRALSSQT